MINNDQQWAAMSNNEQRFTFESENRWLCVVLDRYLHLTKGGHPGKSNLVKPTNLVGIILNREYLSVSSTGDRGVCIIKDGLVTIFLRGHRAAVGEAGICHLRWFRHLKVEFARLCDHHDRSSGWELRQKNMGGQKDLGYPSHQHPQTSRGRICRNRNDEKLTFAPAASMLWTHSSRVSIITEQLIVMIVMVRMVIKMMGKQDLPVVRMDEDNSLVFLIRSLQEWNNSPKQVLCLKPARALNQWTQPTLQVGHVVQHLEREVTLQHSPRILTVQWNDEDYFILRWDFTILGKKEGCKPTSSLML